MARINYQYEKRARELAKKKKREEKLKRKQEHAVKGDQPEEAENPPEGSEPSGEAGGTEAPQQ